MSENGFYWKKIEENGISMILLGYVGEAHSLKAQVAPAYGSNLCRFTVCGRNVIDYDSELLIGHDYTGTPVLYPTPNRVRNGMFRWKGRVYNQQKRGEPVFEHGLVHDEAWQYGEPASGPDSVSFPTWIDFDEGSPLFEAFPFQHRLSLVFTLTRDGVEAAYAIENKSDMEIPFGFGLHPYFMKLSGDDGTTLTLPAKYVMDYTADLLPTGRLIETAGTVYDLGNAVCTGSLDLDHVFTGIPQGSAAHIDYTMLGFSVHLKASADFTHLVVYSPRGKGFFCVENQTCSTDAHNLHERGFAAESGLKFVQAGTTHSGSVKYQLEWR